MRTAKKNSQSKATRKNSYKNFIYDMIYAFLHIDCMKFFITVKDLFISPVKTLNRTLQASHIYIKPFNYFIVCVGLYTIIIKFFFKPLQIYVGIIDCCSSALLIVFLVYFAFSGWIFMRKSNINFLNFMKIFSYIIGTSLLVNLPLVFTKSIIINSLAGISFQLAILINELPIIIIMMFFLSKFLSRRKINYYKIVFLGLLNITLFTSTIYIYINFLESKKLGNERFNEVTLTYHINRKNVNDTMKVLITDKSKRQLVCKRVWATVCTKSPACFHIENGKFYYEEKEVCKRIPITICM